jgi:hypothetical protein
MHEQSNERFEVVITEAGQLPAFLAEAEEALKREARSRDIGILVTRHDLNRYSAALHQDVPFGETWEWSLI